MIKDIKEAIAKIARMNSLSSEESFTVMTYILKGRATPSQIASLITALRMKGEDVDEITGFALAMRSESARIDLPGVEIADTCGTGGDMKNTFNISTTAAFVAAGAGITVAKHGNRCVSSRCGSADVLQALGVNISLGPEEAGDCLKKTGICFLFAPIFHSAMKHAAAPRKEIGIRTIFNILGPLTNPAGAKSQLIGVYNRELVEKVAYVLLNLGSTSALVVHGLDGMDEISVSDDTCMGRLRNGVVDTCIFDPSEYGIKKCPAGEISGGTAEQNAGFLLEVLEGGGGPRKDVTVLNGAACILAAGKAGDFREALEKAVLSVDSGKALEKLELLKRVSNEYGNS